MGVGLVLMHGLVPQGHGVGTRGGRVLLGARIELALATAAWKRAGRRCTKTYRLYDWDEPSRSARGQRRTVTAAQCRPAAHPSGRSARHRLAPRWRSAKSAPRRSQRLRQAAVADLCRRSALGAAAVAGGQGVSRPPQASVLPARRGHAVPRPSRRRAGGPDPGQRRPAYNQQHGSERRLLRHVRVRRRPGERPTRCWTPPPAGCAAAAATAIRGPDRLLDQLSLRPADRRVRHAAADHDEPQPAATTPACWSRGACRRRRTSMPGGSSIRSTWSPSGKTGPSGLPGAAA